MTPRQRRIRNSRIRHALVLTALGLAVAVAAIAQNAKPISGHTLANEYSRVDFYQEQK